MSKARDHSLAHFFIEKSSEKSENSIDMVALWCYNIDSS